MGYQIRITPNGGASVLLDTDGATPSIDYELFNKVDQLGRNVGGQIVLPFHGFIRGTDASDTFAKWLELYNLAKDSNVVTVDILLDNTVKQSFSPAGPVIGSPYIRNLATIPQGGSFVNMVEFTMEIVIERALIGGSGKPTEFGNLSNLQREVQREVFNNRIQAVTWRARATGPAAQTLVQAMRPTGLRPVVMNFLRKVDENSWEAEYRFEQTQDGQDLILWEESIQVSGGDSPLIEVPRTDDADPIIEQGRRRAARVMISGKKISLLQKIVLPQPAFYLPSRFYDATLGHVTPTIIENPIKGTYQRLWTYHYVVPTLEQVSQLMNAKPKPPVRPDSIDFLSKPPDNAAPAFTKGGSNLVGA